MNKKQATRKQLIVWLAQAMCHVPPNLCSIDPFEMPPRWVKDALAELNANGITITDSPKKSKKQKKSAR